MRPRRRCGACSAASRRSSTSPPGARRQRPGIRIRRPRGPRDVFTTAAGYRTLRFTDRRLTGRPEHVANAIRAVLADRRAA
jgi:hypothetical protein